MASTACSLYRHWKVAPALVNSRSSCLPFSNNCLRCSYTEASATPIGAAVCLSRWFTALCSLKPSRKGRFSRWKLSLRAHPDPCSHDSLHILLRTSPTQTHPSLQSYTSTRSPLFMSALPRHHRWKPLFEMGDILYCSFGATCQMN